MSEPQAAIFNEMGRHQWYVHFSREPNADLGVIRSVISQLRSDCKAKGINLVVGFGPDLLADLSGDVPADFRKFETVASIDGSGREAIGTQEELLFWLNSPKKDEIWKAQYDARTALKGHMSVARETPTFIYGESLDMTGFTDGTGNPDPADEPAVALVPDGSLGAGGSFILAQRWVHNLDGWNEMPVKQQENIFGISKDNNDRQEIQQDYSHLVHVELREGRSGYPDTPKRDEIVRRSTPYALHDGTVGLYFMAFCREQAPLRERLSAMYGQDGQPRDKLTDFSNPVSGSYYFAPSEEQLAGMLG